MTSLPVNRRPQHRIELHNTQIELLLNNLGNQRLPLDDERGSWRPSSEPQRGTCRQRHHRRRWVLGTGSLATATGDNR